MLISDAVPIPVFANHESFHLKYGWLKKAYDQTKQDGRVFMYEDAPVRLGVGKNMVRAIKFWSVANKIIQTESSKKGSVIPTKLGDVIFNEKGIDPYLEKPDTLWLLHWLLFAPPCRVPVWWIIMNEFSATNIKIEDLTESVVTRITNIAEWKTPSPKSIKKDIDVFVHTYSTRQDKLSMEDYLDCPFRQLHMIKQSSRNMMRFVYGKKYGLSPLITAFSCLDFIKRVQIKGNSISVNRLASEVGSVGNIFKINENDLASLLKEACNISKSIQMENINGSQHLILIDSLEDALENILATTYNRKKISLYNKQSEMEMLLH